MGSKYFECTYVFRCSLFMYWQEEDCWSTFHPYCRTGVECNAISDQQHSFFGINYLLEVNCAVGMRLVMWVVPGSWEGSCSCKAISVKWDPIAGASLNLSLSNHPAHTNRHWEWNRGMWWTYCMLRRILWSLWLQYPVEMFDQRYDLCQHYRVSDTNQWHYSYAHAILFSTFQEEGTTGSRCWSVSKYLVNNGCDWGECTNKNTF